jgi:hypothetical protein
MSRTIYPESASSYERSLLQNATSVLERTASTTSSGAPGFTMPTEISTIWATRMEQGRLRYVLTLSDGVSEVKSEFYPSDLEDRASPPLLSFRMARLWGDLLEKQSHRRLEALRKLEQQ